MNRLCPDHIATRTVKYNHPCPSCAGYAKSVKA